MTVAEQFVFALLHISESAAQNRRQKKNLLSINHIQLFNENKKAMAFGGNSGRDGITIISHQWFSDARLTIWPLSQGGIIIII